MGHKSTILTEDPLDQAFGMSQRQSETDICLPEAGMDVSDAVSSVAFPHFQLLLCSGEKARADR